MTAVVLATVGGLAALLVLVRSLRPSPRLRAVVGRATSTGASPTDRSATGARQCERLVGHLAAAQPALVSAVDQWLHLTEQSWADLWRRAVRSASVGAIAGAALGATALAAGSSGAVLGMVVVSAGAVGGAVVPVAALRRQADEVRRQAGRSVGATLDLVVMCLAGGMGVESALQAAAEVSDDAFSRRVAHAVTVSGAGGFSPWERLSTLGDELGVHELSELAATMRLAGSEGARVRDTLAAKSDALRARHLADEETLANTVTERLFLPGVLLLVGFLLFIGYPAVFRILSGL